MKARLLRCKTLIAAGWERSQPLIRCGFELKRDKNFTIEAIFFVSAALQTES
jgi:hypothetical protein